MKIVAVVPARMSATRFPGKPLANISGLPMIEHVRRRVAMCSLIDDVFVATCDKEIYEAVVNFGGKSVMTADTHERCTDRVAEAALDIDADIIVNVQGDEPLVMPEMFEPLLKPLIDDKGVYCTNLMAEIHEEQDFVSSNVVKTVYDLSGNAVYFSREPIPSASKAKGMSYKKYKQLGIIAFRKDFLQKFTALTPTPLEIVESVDMLRAIEHGYKIRMVLTEFQSIGVDTPEDLERAEKLMAKDKLVKNYIR
ncbi:MAG: 3-deoxy-manno-octulosonate cytidylyltransferase [Clostridia bacterium]|nr:3-deoxy-manno-octulosonate cytidylyltransferase [Clostridia bacterium]